MVVVGAHLDSVPEGPGINDDGSGTATLLAQAQELASGRYKPRQKIRFAWWGAEENGLVGSSYYARNLSDKEAAKIDVMLDYDMLASANYILGVYDGDGDDPEEGVDTRPARRARARSRTSSTTGSRRRAARRQGRVRRPLRLRRLHQPRHPVGRHLRRRRGRQDAQQEQWYGGAAGSWYDPCYHQICDNLMTVLTGVMPLGAEGLGSRGRRRASVPRAARWPAGR